MVPNPQRRARARFEGGLAIGAITQGTAEIKLVLNTKDAEAEYRRWLATMKGGAVSVPGFAPGGGGGTVPGGGVPGAAPGGGGMGGAFLGGALGGLLGSSGIVQMLARSSPIGAFSADMIEGTGNYAARYGSDVANAAGGGTYLRGSSVAGTATDRTQSMLKYAAGGMSDAQILAIQQLNLGLAQMEADNATRVDKVVGGSRIEEMAQKITDAIFKVKDAITGSHSFGYENIGGR